MSLEPLPSTICSRVDAEARGERGLEREAVAVRIARDLGGGASRSPQRTRGLGPRGFSFDASLMMRASASPNSRASSSIGLPGTYGAMRADIVGRLGGHACARILPAAMPGGNVGVRFHATAAG